MLQRRRIRGDAAPAFSTIVGTVHAALIGGPCLSSFREGAEQNGAIADCSGWIRPAVKEL
jgi:hypothetical protein